METSKIRGFCLRFPWKAADGDFSLLEAGFKVARDHGVAYSIYCEVYAPSFTLKRNAELAAEMRKFDEHIRTGGPLLPEGPH